MNRIILRSILFTVFCLSIAYGQKAPVKPIPVKQKQAIEPQKLKYNLKFKINGLKDSTCYIGHFYGKNQYVKKDTAVADKNGNLVFFGDKELEPGVYILTLPKQYIEFLISSDEKPFFSLETDTADVIGKMKITNSKENEAFYGFQKFTSEKALILDSYRKQIQRAKGKPEEAQLKEEGQKIEKELNDFRKEFFDKHPKSLTVKLLKAANDIDVPPAPKDKDGKIDSMFQPRYYKYHYWDNFDLTDDAIVRTPFFHARLEKYFKNLVYPLPDSIIKDADEVIAKMKSKESFKYTVWYLLNTYENSNLMGMDAVPVHLSDKYYLSGKAFWIDSTTKGKIKERADILRPLLLGKKFPDTYLTDTNGKVIPVNSIPAKYTIVVFWDPDCGHCQKEIPILFKIAKEYENKGVVFYSATTIRKPAPWKKYIREQKLFNKNWYNVWDSLTVTDFARRYDVYSTPVLYMLDEKKNIYVKRISADQVREVFEKQLFKDDKKAPTTSPKPDKIEPKKGKK